MINNNIDDKYNCSNEYLLMLILFLKSNKVNYDIYDLINDIYDYKIQIEINVKLFKELLIIAEKIDISNEIKSIKFLKLLLKHFNKIIKNKEMYLYDNFKYIFMAFIMDKLYMQDNKTSYEYITSLKYIFMNNLYFNYNDNLGNLINSIKKIDDEYNNDNIEFIIRNNTILELLQNINIDTIGDLKKADKELVKIIFIRNYEKYIELFKEYYIKEEEDIFKPVINLIKNIKINAFKSPRLEKIYYLRNGIMSDKKTLEEIANDFGVTRERIRQIELKANTCLKKYSSVSREVFLSFARKIRNKNNYIEYKVLEEELKGEENTKLFITLLNKMDIGLKYNYEYEILYFEDKLKELESNMESMIPYVIKTNDLNKYNNFETNYIKNKYREYKGLLIKRGINLTILYCDIVDELYPNGFKFNKEFCDNINAEVNKRYGIDPVNDRSIYSYIGRSDYCYIDRGTSINRKFANQLDEETKNEIIEYLYKFNNSAVYYESIFEIFKDKLIENGITNRYYLKGVLDPALKDDFNATKDYISVGSTNISGTDMLINEINKIEGEQNFEKFCDRFSGLSKSFLYCKICQNQNTFFRYGGHSFFNFDINKITTQVKNIMKEIIENIFVKNKVNILSGSKIYGVMKLLHEDIMENFEYFTDQYEFYTLLMRIFPEYYYKRPYISKYKLQEINNYTVIDNYINGQEYFTKNIITNFCNKIHIRNFINYLEYIIDKSNDYVQINREMCIKKNNINLKESELRLIKNEIEFSIESFDKIDTRNGIAFDFYPNIAYKWNNELLIGIIRTYFNNDYFIEYTDKNYKKTEYIIRRKK